MTYNGRDPYTYDRAVEFCQNNGMKLCSRAQYCKGGKGGVLLSGAGYMGHGDKWAPVSDGDNTWIQTGNGGRWSMLHEQCWTHSELGHGKASWGTTGLKYGAGGDGRGLCCSGKGLRCLRSLF